MQLPLFGRQVEVELRRTEHGGEVRRGRRKLERPVSTRRPMHVVLTSRRARGPWSLRKHDRAVRDVLRRMARRFDIRIYDYANVGFVANGLDAERIGFRFDTSVRGNGNGGHNYGTELSPGDKEALLEYLKTL